MAWWEYPTNYSNGTEVDGAGDFFFGYTSSITNGYFGLGVILILWMVIFGVSLGFGSKKALLTASFISFFFSLMLVIKGWLNPIVTIVMLILTIVGALGSKNEGGL